MPDFETSKSKISRICLGNPGSRILFIEDVGCCVSGCFQKSLSGCHPVFFLLHFSMFVGRFDFLLGVELNS